MKRLYQIFFIGAIAISLVLIVLQIVERNPFLTVFVTAISCGLNCVMLYGMITLYARRDESQKEIFTMQNAFMKELQQMQKEINELKSQIIPKSNNAEDDAASYNVPLKITPNDTTLTELAKVCARHNVKKAALVEKRLLEGADELFSYQVEVECNLSAQEKENFLLHVKFLNFKNKIQLTLLPKITRDDGAVFYEK